MFTALISPIILPLQIADARLDGIDQLTIYDSHGIGKNPPFVCWTDGSHNERIYVGYYNRDVDVTYTDSSTAAKWDISFNAGGANLIITNANTVSSQLQLNESGGLLIPGDDLPINAIGVGSIPPFQEKMTGSPVTRNTTPFIGSNTTVDNTCFFNATWPGDADRTTNPNEYHEFIPQKHSGTFYTGLVMDIKYQLDGSGVSGGNVGTTDFNPGTLHSVNYFLYLSIPLPSRIAPDRPAHFIVVLQSEVTQPDYTSDVIDLRRYIANMSWTTSIDKGYDTATVTLNESASNLGKYFSYLIGQNLDIIDIYGNHCYSGLVSNVYVDGAGGRIDCIGYKATMGWFRFDRAYLPPTDDGFTVDSPGPTTPQVLGDVMKANPYMYRDSGLFADRKENTWRANTIIGYYQSDVFHQALEPSDYLSWAKEQLLVTSDKPPNVPFGMDILDFSDGSFKCSDAIELLESLGFAYSSRTIDSEDAFYVQCWKSGFTEICVVPKDVTTYRPQYVITKQNLKYNNQGVEISSDINNIFTETYTLYNSSDGQGNVSTSSYNTALAKRYGFRLRIETSDVGANNAALITAAGVDDKSNIIGIGNISITGNVRGGVSLTGIVATGTHIGGGGAMTNLPCYMMRAGRVVELQDNIGFGSLYKNKSGTPGIFYIGSTSFSTDTGVLTLTPAPVISVIDMFIKRQSAITN